MLHSIPCLGWTQRNNSLNASLRLPSWVVLLLPTRVAVSLFCVIRFSSELLWKWNATYSFVRWRSSFSIQFPFYSDINLHSTVRRDHLLDSWLYRRAWMEIASAKRKIRLINIKVLSSFCSTCRKQRCFLSDDCRYLYWRFFFDSIIKVGWGLIESEQKAVIKSTSESCFSST